MPPSMKRCTSCRRYTLKDNCPKCNSSATSPVPAKFSPQDRYGAYRRKAIIEEYGENGKYRDL